jgi:cysteine desulfurase
MRVYLDNASTTPLDAEVFAAMEPFLKTHFGNPSSIHSHGRESRSAIEKARKVIAELLNVSPSEIFFTSGGTEADNSVICGIVHSLGVKNVISSRIEHHAVLHTLDHISSQGLANIHYVNLEEKGHIDYGHLAKLLNQNPNSLVTLMHANNEIGNISDLEYIGNLCKESDSYFHSDTVQTVGHYVHNLQLLNLHAMVGSAHKFHGPKGIGFMYIRGGLKIDPYIHGGSQERNMRGGTENVYGIVGLAKALEICYRDMNKHRSHIENLKTLLISKLDGQLDGVSYNGDSANLEKSNYKVLNVCLPESPENEMLLFNLDISGVSASGGSACTSGSNVGSHVLKAIGADPERGAVRFSFSKLNTEDEILFAAERLSELYVTSQE